MGYWSDYVNHHKADMLILFFGNHGRRWFDEQYSSWDEGMT